MRAARRSPRSGRNTWRPTSRKRKRYWPPISRNAARGVSARRPGTGPGHRRAGRRRRACKSITTRSCCRCSRTCTEANRKLAALQIRVAGEEYARAGNESEQPPGAGGGGSRPVHPCGGRGGLAAVAHRADTAPPFRAAFQRHRAGGPHACGRSARRAGIPAPCRPVEGASGEAGLQRPGTAGNRVAPEGAHAPDTS